MFEINNTHADSSVSSIHVTFQADFVVRGKFEVALYRDAAASLRKRRPSESDRATRLEGLAVRVAGPELARAATRMAVRLCCPPAGEVPVARIVRGER